MINVLRLPEIVVIAFVELMPEVLAITDGVVLAVMEIVQLIRNSQIIEVFHTNAVDNNESEW